MKGKKYVKKGKVIENSWIILHVIASLTLKQTDYVDAYINFKELKNNELGKYNKNQVMSFGHNKLSWWNVYPIAVKI